MAFNRNSPAMDPYSPLPKASSRQNTSKTRLRSASVSLVPEQVPTQTDRHSKRHTYGALQFSHLAGPSNRVMSLPSAQDVRVQEPQRTRSPTRARAQTTMPRIEQQSQSHNPRKLQNLDPRALLRTLNTLLDPVSQRVPDFIDVDHLMALHDRDSMEREHRDMIKLKARSDRAYNTVVCSGLTVFGSSLREATTFASSSTVLGGYEHDLPIVIFRCVQELCRHGFQPRKQPKPDRTRLLALISTFDSEPLFGAATTLDCPNELREVYALLNTYLFALPEPIISSEMFEAIWAWCVLPSLRSTDFLEDDENRVGRQAPTDAGIHVALILLQLLPVPNLSLIVYMMGFFQRLPHMAGEEVGRAVFAGNPSNASDGRTERAETMIRWFLTRWDLVLKALFSDPQTGNVAAESSLATARMLADAASTPRVVSVQPREPPSHAPILHLPSEGLFQRSVATDSDASSISSSVALGERLLDVTLELAQDARRDETRWNNSHAILPADTASISDDSGYMSPEQLTDAPLPPPLAQDPLDMETLTHKQALRRVSALERELERSDYAVADAISETFKARDQVKELESKLRVYEKHPPKLDLKLDNQRPLGEDWYAAMQADTDTLRRQLVEMQRERDEALKLVEDIKKLVGVRGGSG